MKTIFFTVFTNFISYAKLTWMKKPIVFIYTFSDEIDNTAKALLDAGFQVALPYNCPWVFDGIIKIPQSEIEKRGIIRGGLKYLCDNYNSPDTILAEEYVKAEDVVVVYGAMQENSDALVLAERENPSGYGKFERTAYAIIRSLFAVVQGRKVHDMHSGVRGIPGKYLPVFYDMKGSDRDFLLGQIMALRRLNIHLVQCKAVTQGESSAAHTMPELLKDILRVAGLFIKFVSSSLASAIIDIGFYTLMLQVATESLFLASASARVVSSLFNFAMNQFVVFKQNKSQSRWLSMVKYYILVVILWTLDYLGLLLLARVLDMDRVVSKIIMGAIIYAVSFVTQRDVVFKSKKPIDIKEENSSN